MTLAISDLPLAMHYQLSISDYERASMANCQSPMANASLIANGKSLIEVGGA
jgi:hypothetical protein